MKFLSDRALERLRSGAQEPDLSGTHYRLLERVARGGMGEVYAAEDMRLGRRVALKVLDLSDATGELEKRLIREAQVLARLEHPGIVPVHDVGQLSDGTSVLCHEICGREAARPAHRRGQVPPGTAAGVLEDV